MEEKFSSFEELAENVSRGGEVEFIYNGKHYGITHTNEGIMVMEACNYDSIIYYNDPNSIGEYLIENKILKDIIIGAEITFRCF